MFLGEISYIKKIKNLKEEFSLISKMFIKPNIRHKKLSKKFI